MNPQFPIYIVSKGRADTRLTSKALELMRCPYYIVVEEQEYAAYTSVIDRRKVLVLDKSFQQKYDTVIDIGEAKSKGSGPARNFAWEHSISNGHKWHWVCDDNIRSFRRLHDNLRIKLTGGTGFAVMENFCLRYTNVAMAGPNYIFLAKGAQVLPPYVANTRIYSCNLIRNDVPFRWRGRYNEDTDLSLRMLKGGWCTVLFNALLQEKMKTMTVKGGNTEELYKGDGRLKMAQSLVAQHPDVTRVIWRFNRWQHYVDYRPFKANRLRLRNDITLTHGVDNHGMQLVDA